MIRRRAYGVIENGTTQAAARAAIAAETQSSMDIRCIRNYRYFSSVICLAGEVV
ncbi:hypothetical protein M5X06_01545 [Paenibacillus alvei]|uniref:Uncharacterized protein n=1 Tax=Paenibacillus alvei TaxID=44250 RepID=A0ABT4H503_PAEAL|nr:hypothetical protein [Paenibacillus alvei]MCY9764062.1 hypothetical protein [Paenibacillus alvei]MCY9765520.1 hypothetical protein [Paenibacillus alvei]